MSKLKIGPVLDDKPVAMTIKLPAIVHRDLVAYATVLERERGKAIDPSSLVAPMLTRFMATDRTFRRLQRQALQARDG